MNELEVDRGSFRDPAGKVFYYNNRVLRFLNKDGINRLNFLKENNLLENCILNKYLIKSHEINNNNLNLNNLENKIFIEHKKIQYISYPYEWCFDQLKDAALHHLDFHIYLLNNNATLLDGSAFNIQFDGHKPIFIDLLSIKKYENGEYWTAHKQFCENFLNPLILKSKKGIDFNNWFRGNLEGINTKDLNALLSIKDKFSFNIFTQVFLLNFLEQRAIKNKNKNTIQVNKRKFPKKSLLSMLHSMKNFIISLDIKKSITMWDDYSKDNTYKTNEEDLKKKIVKEFAGKYKFETLIDLGCNDGVYSKICLKNGCKYVIGFDYDLNSINNAYKISKKENLNFLPLYFDASNPSPNLGWAQNERKGFIERINFTGMISLAFEHHLAIAKNIPLDQTIKWLTDTAPQGLIEFVPKNDATIKKMLTLKGDIFKNYNEENFKKLLLKNVNIVSETTISDSGRKIFEYKKPI